MASRKEHTRHSESSDEEQEVPRQDFHNNNNNNNNNERRGPSYVNYVPEKPRSYQVKALFRKNIKLQMRQRCTLACQVLVPLILVLFVGAMQVLFNQLVKDQQHGEEDPSVEAFWDLQEETTFFDVANPNDLSALGTLNINGTSSGFLGTIPQTMYDAPVLGNISMPFAEIYSTRFALMKRLEYYKQQLMSTLQKGRKATFVPFPVVSFQFNDIQTTPSTSEDETARIDVQFLVESQFPYALYYHDNDPTKYKISAMNLIANQFIHAATNNTVTISSQQRELPYDDSPIPIDIGSFMAALLYPLVLSWLLPVYVFNIVLEKQERLREMMKMAGLKMRNYWLVTYIYNYILYLIVLATVYALSYAFQFAMFTQGSVIGMLVLFLLWGHAQISLSFFFSAIFGSTRVATIFTYFLVIVQAIVSFVVNVTVFQFDLAPFFWMLYPPFAFYRAIFLLGLFCGADRCPTNGDYADGSFEILHIYLYLFFTSISTFILAFYLDEVLPKQYGIAKKPWFFITGTYRWLANLVKSKRHGASEYIGGLDDTTTLLIKSVPGEGFDDEEKEPEDVARERELVYKAQVSPDAPIVIQDLKKVYGSRIGNSQHLAVRNLTFAIDNGECFGLLGPNGAGKTTTISMLTGLYPPTSGSARVGGFDIRTDIDMVHRVMGVCPQFDTLWMDLTCKETLLFYARLKGVSSKDEDAHVLESLTQVGLENFPTRKVKDLSGGMRRRLSVAVALCGNPRIVFLDEPTTGLDPESRRSLWDVLVKVKVGKCLILTTHSMEEADVLCTKIGIMSKGCLRCVGPQQQLKQRFSQGYSLKINFAVDNTESVDAMIKRILPTAVLIEDFIGSRTYQIPTEDVVISRLFDIMQDAQHESGITDWGINQTSLEDVFLHIVRSDEGADSTMND